MDRTEVRTNVFKILFQLEARPLEDSEEVMDLYCEQNGITKSRDVRQIKERVSGILPHLEEIDAQIEKYSNGWKKNRLGKAELAILRLAVYEILWDEKVPSAVAANEAVNLCKNYAQEKAPTFVNGILAKVIETKEQQ